MIQLPRLRDTIRPLLLAPLGAVVVFAAFGLSPQPGFAGFGFLAAMVWGYSLAAGLVFVVPVLALAPRWRRPPVWVAGIWGVLVASAFAGLIIGRPSHLLVPVMTAGAASELVYAVAARWLHPDTSDSLAPCSTRSTREPDRPGRSTG